MSGHGLIVGQACPGLDAHKWRRALQLFHGLAGPASGLQWRGGRSPDVSFGLAKLV